MMADLCVIAVNATKEFITYGIGIPLMQMRFPERARGRALVSNALETSNQAIPLSEK